MANVTVTFTITEFCLYTGVSEEELHEIVGLGVIEPHEDETFDDHALTCWRRTLSYARKTACCASACLALSAILSMPGPAWCWSFYYPPRALNDIAQQMTYSLR